MARGWESKDVESRQEQLENAETNSAFVAPTPEEREKERRRHLLEMNRVRLLSELQRACNPRMRAQIERELEFVGNELDKLT